jgi:hypothetical protein
MNTYPFLEGVELVELEHLKCAQKVEGDLIGEEVYSALVE